MGYLNNSFSSFTRLIRFSLLTPTPDNKCNCLKSATIHRLSSMALYCKNDSTVFSTCWRFSKSMRFKASNPLCCGGGGCGNPD